MAGNVFQWCADWYDVNTYRSSGPVARNPVGPVTATGYRVLRGGSWINIPVLCRSAYRSWFNPVHRDFSYFGFRCASSGQ